MSKIFEDLATWQKAKDLSILVYHLFKNNKDFRFRDQICSAAVSVMNNIAEGYERHSNKEFTHFLYIAKGSCGEVRSMSYLALELEYISRIEFNGLNETAIENSKMIYGLIKSINK